MKRLSPLVLVALMVTGVSCRAGEPTVRPCLQTGNWYPSDAESLNDVLVPLFTGIPDISHGQVRGMVLPHAGYSYSGRTAAQAVAWLKGQDVRRVVILGVAHRSGFRGACVSGFDWNRTPLGDVKLDRKMLNRLSGEPLFQRDDTRMTMEHSIENQIPLLQHVLGSDGWQAVPILIGSVDSGEAERIAARIRPFLDDRTIVVASSDMTHYGKVYGYVPFTEDILNRVRNLDNGFVERVLARDTKGLLAYRRETGITACGTGPLLVLMNLMQKRNIQGRLVAYTTSGDISGNTDIVVGYASIAFCEGEKEADMEQGTVEGVSPENQTILLELARKTIAAYVAGQPIPEPDLDRLPAELKESRSVFVTLRKNGSLRGCIGNLGRPDPLVVSVRDYAINAATRDPRFPPVKPDELDDLHIEISVMTPMREISSYKLVRLGTDGVVIRKNGYGAVYLPQVATETGWNLDQFMTSLCRKAGLPGDAYTGPGMTVYVFQAHVFQEAE